MSEPDPFDFPIDAVSRRRFLTLLGASAALAAGTGCSRVDRGTMVSTARKLPEAAPGVASRYASTFQESLDSFGVLVKTREGRPIHIEGNDLDPFARGKAPLRAIADVLRLYDPDRLRQPLLDARPAAWGDALAHLASGLQEARSARRPVLLLTGALTSPTRQSLVATLKQQLPSLEHVRWEPSVSDEEQSALQACFGSAARFRPRIDQTRVLLCLEADPLGSGLPDRVAAFAEKRRSEDRDRGMSRLFVLEGGMSLTGAKADHRWPLSPARSARVAFALARRLHERGLALPPGVAPQSLAPFDPADLAKRDGVPAEWLQALAEDLLAARGAALVLTGPALPFAAHVAGHLLNAMLGAEGQTIETVTESASEPLTSLAELRTILGRMAGGEYGAAIVWDANPAYAFPDPALVRSAFEKTPVRVHIGLHRDETAALCPIVLAEHHWLESWGDAWLSTEVLGLRQPALQPLYETRAGEEVLLHLISALGGAAPKTYPEFLEQRWRREVHAGGSPVPFERFWHAALHDGVVKRSAPKAKPQALRAEAVNRAARQASDRESPEGFELVLGLGLALDGRYANNGWLQELPDPITRLTWGNAASVSPTDAQRLRLADGMVVRLTAGGASVEVPAVVQPGQAPGVITLQLGHGRSAGTVATGIGANAFRLLTTSGGPTLLRGVALVATGVSRPLATTQWHNRMEGRDIVRSQPRSAGEAEEVAPAPPATNPGAFPTEHRWGMAIDLSACVGCAACVIACQSENNVPVVGPEQVRRGREMHWIRIDRYYEGDPQRPRVLIQPMLCQHCGHAPCETVCPVNATTHSPEGLNQMAYSRCVGTRYCANNCPYKVRRFNFLDFTGSKAEPESLVFNPEVTVRPRGVMEKCTFCVQRIEDARQQAKIEQRPIREDEIAPACAVACPAGAIVFGDLNRPDSRVAALSRSPRGYRVLGELGTRPAINYLAEIKNPLEIPGDAREDRT